jgi:nucleotide-binding universal stress UspA family protein
MFHNILVCVDDSLHAERALGEAIDLALAGRGRITLLTSVPRPPIWAASPATIGAVEPLASELQREAEATLRTAVERVPKEIPVTTVLSQKPIREALLKRLSCGGYDLLVMGSRGRGALTASVLGSVSHFALNHANVPVLIVHADGERGEREPEPEALSTVA